jgi:hypothetical protein
VSDLLKVPGKYHCPACGREVYLRRRKTCEFCGAELPESVQLSEDEREIVDEQMRELHDRRARDRAEEEEKKRERRRRDDGGSALISF